MLKKIIKYDLRANIRVIAGTYCFIMVFAVFHLIMEKLCKLYPGVIQWTALEEITFILQILGIGVGFGITIVACILHFRKSMFKDEGYLTHTLPISEGKIFAGKYLATVILFFVNIAGAYITIAISTGKILWCMSALKSLQVSIMEAGTKVDGRILVLLAASAIVGMFYMISQVFSAMTIGYSFGKKMNKDIFSFLVYFAEYMIMQVFSLAIVIISAVGKGMLTQVIMNENTDAVMLGNYINDVLGANLVLMIIMTIAYCMISVSLLKRKLNID